MQTCPNCAKENTAGEPYCFACGHILPAALLGLGIPISTLQIDEVYEKLEPQRRWGTAYFAKQSELQLTFRDTGEKLNVKVEDEIVLGRVHNAPQVAQPHIDLRPYQALEKGVSRRHAALTRDQDTIVIQDLGSANHTFLNGQRLLPYEPRILRDNDELRLAHLVIWVAFIYELGTP